MISPLTNFIFLVLNDSVDLIQDALPQASNFNVRCLAQLSWKNKLNHKVPKEDNTDKNLLEGNFQ